MDLSEVREMIRHRQRELVTLEAKEAVLMKREKRQMTRYPSLVDAEADNCPIWKDKNGLYHPIIKMNDSHLRNVVAYLKVRKEGLSEASSAGWMHLCSLQGEMAQYITEGALDQIDDELSGIGAMIGVFHQEQLRREGSGKEWRHPWVING